MISEVFFDLGKLSFNVGKVIRLSSYLECGGAITKCRHVLQIVQLKIYLGHFTVFCMSQRGKSEGNNQLCSLIANIQ